MSEEFDNKVIEILECVGNDPETNLMTHADKIHTLARYARQTPIFKNGSQKGTEFFKGLSDVELYNHMIIKISESPTKFHAVAAVILTIPYISDALMKLNGAGQKVETGTRDWRLKQ